MQIGSHQKEEAQTQINKHHASINFSKKTPKTISNYYQMTHYRVKNYVISNSKQTNKYFHESAKRKSKPNNKQDSNYLVNQPSNLSFSPCKTT